MEHHERRDLLARAARDRLAELTAVSPRSLAGLDAATAGAMARAILYPNRAIARRARQQRMMASTGRRLAWTWPMLLAVILLPIGAVLGGAVKQHAAPATHSTARTLPVPAASTLPGFAQSAAPGPSVAPAPADPLVEAATAAINGRVAPGRASGDPAVTRGDLAAYVRTAVAGAAAVDTCYAYLHSDGSAWSADAVACGRGAGFAPANGATLPVHTPGTCARLRSTAGSTGAVLTCVPDGISVSLTGEPLYREGRIWWPAAYGRVVGYVAIDAFGLG